MAQIRADEGRRGCVGSDCTTEGVRIVVRPSFHAADSDLDAEQWMFAYRILVANEGREPARLLTRRWEVVNADGEREVVAGPGVVGKTPRLEPGESFEYTSFCPLSTNWGTMEGSFHFRTDAGREFDAMVGRFILVGPLNGEM